MEGKLILSREIFGKRLPLGSAEQNLPIQSFVSSCHPTLSIYKKH